MPIIRVTLMEGRTYEQKRDIARAITEAMVKAGSRPEGVRVIFEDVSRDDWFFGDRVGLTTGASTNSNQP